MGSVNIKSLDSAYLDRAFEAPLTALQMDYYRGPVVTAWNILHVVEERSPMGIESEEIAIESGLSQNTVKLFLAWLERKGLIGSRYPVHNFFGPPPAQLFFRILEKNEGPRQTPNSIDRQN